VIDFGTSLHDVASTGLFFLAGDSSKVFVPRSSLRVSPIYPRFFGVGHVGFHQLFTTVSNLDFVPARPYRGQTATYGGEPSSTLPSGIAFPSDVRLGAQFLLNFFFRHSTTLITLPSHVFGRGR